MTADDLIMAAFRKVGVDSPTTTQQAQALVSLNNMLDMWSADKLVHCVTTEAFSASSADPEYTIGSGGQWDTVRPMKVLRCFLRDSDNYDWPVTEMSSRDYNYLNNKTFTARPQRFYFLPEFPLAKIIFDASPDADYDAYFEFDKPYTECATTAAALTAPNEYKEGIVYNLAVSLGEDWGRIIPKTVLLKAEKYKDILKRLIASTRKPARARFDMAGLGGRGTDYNIITDDTIDGGA